MTEPTGGGASRSFGDQLKDIVGRRWVQVVGVIVVVLVAFGLFTYSKINQLHQQGVDKETALTVAYPSCQNELGTFISTFYEQTGVADRKISQFNTVLEDAVKGRYDNTGLATPAVPGQPQGNQLISALVEAYPDLTALNSYDRILDTISSGRTAFKNCQNDLLDKLRSYDKWRHQNIFGSLLIRLAGFPSDNLRAQVGQRAVTGGDAEAQMYVIVLPSDVNQAYTSGTLEPLTVPPLTSSGK